MKVSFTASFLLTICLVESTRNYCRYLPSDILCRCRDTGLNLDVSCTVTSLDKLHSLSHGTYAPYVTSLIIGLYHIPTLPASALTYNNLVSLTVRGEHLESIDDDAFKGLEDNLLYLHLESSSLKKIPTSAIERMTTLHTLNMEGNRITALNTSLRSLPLRKLVLRLNQISIIARGKFPATLKFLDLVNNTIYSLNRSLTGNLFRLTELYISNNFISDLDRQLEELPQLKILDASHNSIRNVDGGVLSRIFQLQILDLSFNRIHQIVNAFDGLEFLQKLDLSHNRLVGISERALRDLVRLKVLILSYNRINHLDETVFDCLSSLTDLDIRRNNLRDLDFLASPPVLEQGDEICNFRNFSTLRSLRMSRSGVNCSAESRSTVRFLRRKGISVRGNPCKRRG